MLTRQMTLTGFLILLLTMTRASAEVSPVFQAYNMYAVLGPEIVDELAEGVFVCGGAGKGLKRAEIPEFFQNLAWSSIHAPRGVFAS